MTLIKIGVVVVDTLLGVGMLGACPKTKAKGFTALMGVVLLLSALSIIS